MNKLVMITAAVTSVVLLGVFIDAQSQMMADHRPSSLDSGQPVRIFAFGRVEGTTEEIELRPRITGAVQKLLVKEGDLVAEGEILLRLEDEQYRHEVTLAEAGLQQAEARLARLLSGAREQERREAEAKFRARQADVLRAEQNLARIRQLRISNAASQQELEDQIQLLASFRAQADAAQARFELLQADPQEDEVALERARVAEAASRLALARHRLEQTRLIAPHESKILAIDIDIGEMTGPEAKEPPVTLVGTGGLRVRAWVDEMDAPRVQTGMQAKISADGLPDRTFAGSVSNLSPRMEQKRWYSDQPTERFDTKVREIWLDVKECEELVVGLPVDVMIDPQPASVATEETPSTAESNS